MKLKVETNMPKQRTLVFFSESRIALDREVAKHPNLVKLLQDHPVTEFELRLTEIATYCNILVDGAYTSDDLDGLCDLCVAELVKKRMPMCNLVTNSGGLDPKKLG